MFTEVVTSHELFAADGTFEVLLSRVRAEVTSQFVGPRKPLAAVQPSARKRTLSCMGPEMRLEVRALAVHLGTSGVGALVVLAEHSPWGRVPWGGAGRVVHHLDGLLLDVVLVELVIVRHLGHGFLLDLRQVREDAGDHVDGGLRPLGLLGRAQVQGSVVLVTRVKHRQQTLRREVYVLVHPK